MFKFAFRNLLSRPMRSLLSLLGLTVAILGMVGLFSVARGLDRLVSSTFERIDGFMAMQPGAPIPLFSRLPAGWGAEMAAVPGVAHVSPEVWTRVNVIDEKMIISPPRFLFGTDIPSRLALRQGIYRDDVVAGRFLTPADRGTRNAVISRQIAEEFHKSVGDTLRVNGVELPIVGIYHCGSLLLDIAIIVDIDEVRDMTRFDPGSVSSFYVEQTGEVPDDALTASIREKFRGRESETSGPWMGRALDALNTLDSREKGNAVSGGLRSLARWIDVFEEANWGASSEGASPEARGSAGAESPKTPSGPPGSAAGSSASRAARSSPGSPAPGDFMHVDESTAVEIRSATAWAERFDRMADDLDIFLTVLTGIGVTIAVLSIVNTMLMSVTERMIEFGILKANGWSRTDVLLLITSESGLLGVTGGVLGSLAGWAGTHVINTLWPTRVTLYASPGLIVISILFSTALGILGGLYPALWAMRMMPMDAIRRG